MALSQNQPKRGTQRGVSSGPDGAKTGRGVPTQDKRGYRGGKDSNDSDRSTRPVPKETQSTIGATRNGSGSADTKSIPDGVGSPLPSA